MNMRDEDSLFHKFQNALDVFIHVASVAMILVCFICIGILHHEYTTAKAQRNAYEPIQRTTEELIKRVFKEEASYALAVAMAESQCKNKRGDKHLTYEVDGKVYGDSLGPFQIRTFPDRPDRLLLSDPDFNVRYAKLLRDKYGWGIWSTVTSGKVRAFLPVLRPAKTKIKITQGGSI